jgi:cytochrome c
VSVARVGLLAAALAACATAGACRDDIDYEREASLMTHGGRPERGRALIQQYGCGSCHKIPGVPGATGGVGPSLKGLQTQSYIAGVMQHTPDNLVRWVRDPQGVDPRTAMPNLDVPERDARDIVAYLYTIKP